MPQTRWLHTPQARLPDSQTKDHARQRYGQTGPCSPRRFLFLRLCRMCVGAGNLHCQQPGRRAAPSVRVAAEAPATLPQCRRPSIVPHYRRHRPASPHHTNLPALKRSHLRLRALPAQITGASEMNNSAERRSREAAFVHCPRHSSASTNSRWLFFAELRSRRARLRLTSRAQNAIKCFSIPKFQK
jgi:hypothetical protein